MIFHELYRPNKKFKTTLNQGLSSFQEWKVNRLTDTYVQNDEYLLHDIAFNKHKITNTNILTEIYLS